MKHPDYFRKRVTVMGLGLHGGGVAVTQWLVKQGANVTVTDLRDARTLRQSLDVLKKLPVRFVLGGHRNRDFIQTDCIIKNPGVPTTSPYIHIARQHHIPIETDISIFLKLVKNQIIAVTGTKGKSTTTALITHILKTAGLSPFMAGNIRISPLTILDRITPHSPIILELSSWQLEDIEHLHWSPHIAVLTNIMPDHLNRYPSYASYAKVKSLICKYQTDKDIFIFSDDFPIIRSLIKNVKSKRVIFTTTAKPGADLFIEKNSIFTKKQKTRIIDCKKITFPGGSNYGNCLAAIAVALTLRISLDSIRKALTTFQGVPGRLEPIRSIHNVSFINDTAATTPDATLSALSALGRAIILIAGGSDKKLSYKELSCQVRKHCDYIILLPGTATQKMIRELEHAGFHDYKMAHSMNRAVREAWKLAGEHSSKYVVLSPGAASFGLFKNEFDRGDQFTAYVKNI